MSLFFNVCVCGGGTVIVLPLGKDCLDQMKMIRLKCGNTADCWQASAHHLAREGDIEDLADP